MVKRDRKEYFKEYHRRRQSSQEYRVKNAVKCKKWKEENPDAFRQWILNNPDHNKKRLSKWRKENSTQVQVHNARHRAAKKHAIFVGSDKEMYDFFMEEIYLIAKERTEVTGIRYEVDHIVPLQHDLVCGLHTPINLQILTKSENARKKNQFVV